MDEVLASFDELIGRIRLCFGLDRETFERQVVPLIRRYAAYVHLLPATPDNHHASQGGLLRLGLDVAFYSLQGTDAHIFSGRSTISLRRHLEPRWRLGTFIGGLCSELHRPLSQLTATDPSGATWPAYRMPLRHWLDTVVGSQYFVRWRRTGASESRGLGLFALPMVVPAESLQFLSEENDTIVPHLLASVAGVALYREHNVLDELVRRASVLVADRDLHARVDADGIERLGLHLVRHLVDGMRRLLAENPAWTPNREKSRVWFGSDGLFLIWPHALVDVQRLLETFEFAGVPRSPDVLVDLLHDAGVVRHQDDGTRIWKISPPEARSPIEAVKISSPAILLGENHHQPLPSALARRNDTPPHHAAPGNAADPDPKSGTQYSLIDPPAPPTRDAPHETPAASSTFACSGGPATGKQQAQLQVETPHPDDQRDARPRISFNAPLRLDPAVRAALSAIVDTLNTTEQDAAAFAIADGLFVPLQELEKRGIQPPMALRALNDARVIRLPAPRTCSIGDRTFVGLVLKPDSVTGLVTAPVDPDPAT